jgi:hypothetical protein
MHPLVHQREKMFRLFLRFPEKIKHTIAWLHP